MGIYCIRVIWPVEGARPFPLDHPSGGEPPYKDVQDRYGRTKLNE